MESPEQKTHSEVEKQYIAIIKRLHEIPTDTEDEALTEEKINLYEQLKDIRDNHPDITKEIDMREQFGYPEYENKPADN
ncbi:MAG: hypothetical protein AAGA35_01870 [Patescibacteria group bacterium]